MAIASPLWTLAVLAAALVLDRLIGDPPWLWRSLPHPVVRMGRLIGWLDENLNDAARSFAARKARGVAAISLAIILAAVVGAGLHAGFAALPFPLGLGLEAVAAAILVAQKSLADHVRAVADALAEGLEAGRRAVAQIVGRDVTVLDEAGVARAAIESAAENFSDGVIAPAFWYLVAGLPGLLAYKMANTADSMIGNRSERHAAFGWAGARLDDVLNVLPARLTALALAAAASLSGNDARAAVRAALADARKHKSPNAGWPEAALAGALGLALGGPRRYGAIAVDGAWLNAQGRAEAGSADILRSIRLTDAAWGIALALVILGAVLAAAR